MFNFGAGVLFGTPLQDATGTAIANPSPVQFGVLQEVTVDESWESKMLYGANQFPVAVGRGKGKMSLKAKAANFNATLVNTFLYGVSLTTQYDAIYNDITGTSVPTGAGPTVTPTGQGTFVQDLGVVSAVNGVPYTRVGTAVTPTAGQYSLSGGTYTFSALDNGKTVFISYVYQNAAPTSGRKITVANQLMGVMPVFQVDLMTQYLGKTLYVRYPNAVATKFTRAFKNDDFMIPEFDIDCFADSSGNISYAWFYE